MKIVFDNSIHLGQFCIGDEKTRIAAKNSQVMISTKPEALCVGIESFNENTFSDDTIWELAREPQDIFYKFMDVYHSVKNVIRVPLTPVDAEKALELARDLNIDISNALTCAIAIRHKADEIHSLYGEFTSEPLRNHMATQGIKIVLPDFAREEQFIEEGLEGYYQEALATFRKYSIDLVSTFHQ